MPKTGAPTGVAADSSVAAKAEKRSKRKAKRGEANQTNTKEQTKAKVEQRKKAPSSEAPAERAGQKPDDVAAWRERAEKNRQLRQRFAADPQSLTEDERRRAVVLLERDQRKLRQSEQSKSDKKKITKQPQPPQQERHSKPSQPEAPDAKSAAGDAAPQQRKERGKEARHRNTDLWPAQADQEQLRMNQQLRERLRKDDETLTANERQRAQLLLQRDIRKAEKKNAKIERLAAREAKASAGSSSSAATTKAQTALAGKWGFGEKLAAAGYERLKRGLKRGDWACPSCQSNNFARRSKCIKCNTPAPAEHDRWASSGIGTEVDQEYWAKKRTAVAESEAAKLNLAVEAVLSDQNCWVCSKCGIGNFSTMTECFRCHEFSPARRKEHEAKQKASTEAKKRKAEEDATAICPAPSKKKKGKEVKDEVKEKTTTKKQKKAKKLLKLQERIARDNQSRLDALAILTKRDRPLGLASGRCWLQATSPDDPAADPTTKIYFCGECQQTETGYAAWRNHMARSKKKAKKDSA